jgi:hypothetical protein
MELNNHKAAWCVCCCCFSTSCQRLCTSMIRSVYWRVMGPLYLSWLQPGSLLNRSRQLPRDSALHRMSETHVFMGEPQKAHRLVHRAAFTTCMAWVTDRGLTTKWFCNWTNVINVLKGILSFRVHFVYHRLIIFVRFPIFKSFLSLFLVSNLPWHSPIGTVPRNFTLL